MCRFIDYVPSSAFSTFLYISNIFSSGFWHFYAYYFLVLQRFDGHSIKTVNFLLNIYTC